MFFQRHGPWAIGLSLILTLFLAAKAWADADRRAMLEMPDGVRLETFIYLPDQQPSPVVLMRTPYRFPAQSEAYYDAFADELTRRGYTFVMQNLRGRFGSEGVFDPFENAVEDGAATVRWIMAQPWSNGRIGTIGGSYNGYTALAAAAGAPEVQAVIADDPALDLWAGRRGDAVGLLPVLWLYLLDHGRWPDEAEKERANNVRDPSQIDNSLLGRDDPYWDTYIAGRTGTSDKSLRADIDRICAPVLVIKSKSEGWEDPVDLWKALRQSGCPEHRADHQLIVSAEDHTFHLNQFGKVETDVTARIIAWLDHWLRDGDLTDTAPVLYRPDDAEPFRTADDWPIRGAETSFYLGRRFSLTGNAPLLAAPDAGMKVHALQIDPAKMSPCGDYPSQTYLTAPLERDILVAGPMRLDLFARATTPIAGFSAQVYDYDPDRAEPLEFVTFGVTHAEGLDASLPARLTLDMHSVSHRFKAGTRIALSIGGTACGYAEVDHPDATYEILHGTNAPSRLIMEAVAE
ncbi:CocE/NonD family hydrolase [uncultured Tateyamaria sp.]|uniref:CocE/NonD family hydrolase n=1 Tax=uncultured Tateyamaria sp. TaxID=455651 RepID=UPI00260EFBC0|nr:CocE/NonD family hydrolase [uncultured Tateyamaria sp.]